MTSNDFLPRVRGHEVPKRFFRNAISSGRIAHAYLLTGTDGIGKRTFATHLAAALLCQRPNPDACGSCASCALFGSENHPRFIPVAVPEGKSAIDIQQIRGLIQELALRDESRRVVLIEGADRMPPASANALLKTLEEPPPQVVFLLVTSAPARLLSTIISRCQRATFSGLPFDDFRAVLEEHLELAPEIELSALYAGSGGSPGRALALIQAIEAAGGLDRFALLIDGEGASRPETLLEYCPSIAKETKRDQVRRLTEFVLAGALARRAERPDERDPWNRLAADTLELMADIDANQSADLILERLARHLIPEAEPL